MTVNLTVRQNDLIMVAADSSITNSVTSTRSQSTVKLTEFYTEPRKKFRVFDNVCIVTMWGELPSFSSPLDELSAQIVKSGKHTVDTVAELVLKYLTENYRPHEIFDENGQYSTGDDFTDHTGFHVCGFTVDKKPKCYNIFWGTNIPPESDELPGYHCYPKPYEEQPLNHEIEFIYTGRNDLAGQIIRTFVNEIEQGLETRYNIRTTLGKIQLADLVMRFSSEITPRVGPPFHIGIIDPNNHIQKITNLGFSPLNPVEISS